MTATVDRQIEQQRPEEKNLALAKLAYQKKYLKMNVV